VVVWNEKSDAPSPEWFNNHWTQQFEPAPEVNISMLGLGGSGIAEDASP